MITFSLKFFRHKQYLVGVNSTDIINGIQCYKCDSVQKNGKCHKETKQTCQNNKYCARTKATIGGNPDETYGCDSDLTVEWFQSIEGGVIINIASLKKSGKLPILIYIEF